MTRLLLIRYAHHDYIGRAIAGWLPGVALSLQGQAQAAALPGRLAGAGITAIYSSPLERALETARPVAENLGLSIEIRESLGEVRFGAFTGRTMAGLESDPAWQRFRHYRSGTRAPGGELMVESQVRMVAELERIRERHPGGVAAVFSHSDIIRAAIVHYAGMPLDLFERIEISPASVSVVELSEEGPRILALNATA